MEVVFDYTLNEITERIEKNYRSPIFKELYFQIQ